MKNTRIIFFVLILVVVIWGVYYLGKEKIKLDYQIGNLEVKEIISLRDATTTPEEIATWGEFINNRVGWQFRYPKENLTKDIDEVVKFPSSVEGQSNKEDLLEFAVGETTFSIKTYAEEGASTTTIEAWIKNSGKSVSNYLSDYQKFKIAGNNAYNIKGKAFTYTFLNKNVYEIAAYQNGVWREISDEPLFKKWISTINFFPEVRCWERAIK